MTTSSPSMIRTALVFGSLAGVAVIFPMLLAMTLTGLDNVAFSEALGYLIMLVALSLILIGIKRYRDEALGGVIGFWRALLVGLMISLVASAIYVAVWELYLYRTDYAFINHYFDKVIEAQRQAGATAEVTQLEEMQASYRNPLFRMLVTLSEIFPVGLLVSLVSAALLRFPGFLPRRRVASA